ncbi:MAG: PqqD family protein [Eubacteriales bacterium]|nr:PqqD family protein [Eubacteriales bacterium]
MKIKDGFMLRELGDGFIAVAVGERAASFNGMVKLNATGAFIWKTLESGCDRDGLIRALTDHYDIDAAKAAEAADAFTAQLRKNGFLDE